jgi:Zn finger protein HypA/HybF involved in hydrogenase expression
MTEEEMYDEAVLAMHDTLPENLVKCEVCEEKYSDNWETYYCDVCGISYDPDDPCPFH